MVRHKVTKLVEAHGINLDDDFLPQRIHNMPPHTQKSGTKVIVEMEQAVRSLSSG